MTGSIQFDPATMNQIVSKAIIESISDEQRDLIIQQAVNSLLKAPPRSGYGVEPQTPIQAAFDNAVSMAAMKIAHDFVAENEQLKDKVRALLAQSAEVLLADEYSEFGQKMRKGIAAVMADALYVRND